MFQIKQKLQENDSSALTRVELLEGTHQELSIVTPLRSSDCFGFGNL